MKNDPYKFTGSTLANRYQIEELLGIGGMAAVYRARHLVTTREVAVKILKPDLVYENDRMIADFLNEAKATARLNHRNIVEVTDADLAEDGVVFLAMQYLRVATLEKLLDAEEQAPLDRAAQLLDQICDGVAHAHNAGIVHRDLKPGNIMIESDARGEEIVKILDFGIAKALGATARVSRQVGTLYYASPEQLSLNAGIDHRSDVYSLGIILYQMLTGDVPFEDDSMERIIYQKLNCAPPLLRQRRPDLPAAVEEVVAKALAKDPALRYQSATEMARAFWRAVNLETGALVLDGVDVSTRKEVAGASVYLNGKYAGQTDLDGGWNRAGLAPRQYLIEVEHPKFETWRATVRVESREEAAVIVELKRRPKGEVIVACNVPGAAVWLDGQKAGAADKTGRLALEDVAAGLRGWRAIHPKHQPAEAEVEVAAGEMTFAEAKNAAGKWRFAPFERDGRRVRVRGVITFTVNLTGRSK